MAAHTVHTQFKTGEIFYILYLTRQSNVKCIGWIRMPLFLSLPHLREGLLHSLQKEEQETLFDKRENAVAQ